MRNIIIAAALLACLASCTKERTYLCTLTTYTPRGIVAGPQVKTVSYTGTYTGMKAFEAANTWTDTTNKQGDAPDGAWRTCTCK